MEINRGLEILKTNIIRWYNFKQNSKILILGEAKELYDFLKQNHNVKFQEYDSESKFDYIILKDNIYLLEKCKNILAENGTILLLLNNRWGVTYFAGSDGFETLYKNPSGLLNKEEIENSLNKFGFENYKFFYPLPSYEFANVIYSDDYLPQHTDSKLANNNIYLKDNPLVFYEIELLRNFTKHGDFTKFTNSFLVEINPKSTEKAVFFNNNRKEIYRLITKIYDGQVEKIVYNDSSKNHLNRIKENITNLESHNFNLLDKVQEEKIISRYMETPNIYKEIVQKIKNNEIEIALEIIQKIYNEIKEKFTFDKTLKLNKKYFENLSEKDFFIVKKAYIDLVFENMFFDNEEIYIYDQEWTIENCPLEFVLFRAINNMYMMNSEINEIISKQEMLEKFDLFKYYDDFVDAEMIFQTEILDKEMFDIYHTGRELILSKDELINARKNAYDLGIYKAENIKKEKYISELQSQIVELQSKLENKKGFFRRKHGKK